MRPIRIMSQDFTLLAELDTYTSFSFTRSYFSVGEFELRMNLNTIYSDLLQEGNIVLSDYLSGVITYREQVVGERAENDILSCKGMTLGGLLGRRITVPPEGAAYDSFRIDAESIMHALVEHNAIATTAGRVIPRLVLKENQHRGEVMIWQSRYKPLTEELTQIAVVSGLGWEVEPDLSTEQLQFGVYQGRDLTISQTTNNPVIFSREFDNIRTQRAVSSNSGYRSTAYVGGQGEGTARSVETIGSEYAGLDRFEVFIDARDVDDDADLASRGAQKLAEYPKLLTLQAEVMARSPFVYGRDWDLGDIVTIQNREWGLQMDARITEIQEVIEPQGESLAVNFGTDLPTFMDRIKKDLSQTAQEVTR